ncbi:hypothetical protein ACLOJK_016272 [Asimina triloba]
MAELAPIPNGLTNPNPNQPPANDISNLEEGRSFAHTQDDSAGNNTDRPSNVRKVAAEIVGTFILIFVGCASGFVNQRYDLTIVGVAMSWGLAVMVVIYTLGHVSGAHLNPAVTIALVVYRKFPWKQAPAYIGAQLVGSTLASLTLKALFSKDNPKAALTLPSLHTTDLDTFVWEFIISFILMFVICGVGTDHRAIKELTGVAVGGAILFNVLIAGPITGASMNPARTLGPAIAAHKYDSLWIYLTAPVAGTVFAAVLYDFLQLPNKSEEQTVKTV